jgi:hypothetical protein
MSNEWRGIPGYEGAYEVSDAGQIRTVERVAVRKNGRSYSVKAKSRKLVPNRYGYMSLRLCLNGVDAPKEVHVLVALAFLGPRPEGADVRHLDGDKLNNSAKNLQYGSRSENISDAVVHGTHAMTRRTHCISGHLLSGDNLKPSGRQRVCRECANSSNRAYLARKRLQRAGER